MANICGLCTCAATRKEYNLYQKTKTPRGLIGKPEALAEAVGRPPGSRDSTTGPADHQGSWWAFCYDCLQHNRYSEYFARLFIG